MRYSGLVLLLVFSINICFAQQKAITGKIVDKVTLEPVEFVIVTDLNSNKKTITDRGGNFRIRISKTDSLLFTSIGYKNIVVKPGTENAITLKLEKGVINLKDVIITNHSSLKTFNLLTNFDLNIAPAKSAQDLLRLVPGLFIAQHQGGGKAEQIFLRGFDADHGTDVNITVDGLPVNIVSHAHGQGYADLHFLIPETVSGYDFGKGPYYADKGDFTTAGYVAYRTKNITEENEFKTETGQFQTLRLFVLLNLLNERARKKGIGAYVAAERLYSNGGPFAMPEHFTRYNVFGKFYAKLDSNNKLTFIASYLKSDWRSAGEIPDRAVQEGYIASRYGVLDSAQGGNTQRANFSLKLNTYLPDNSTLENQVWFSHYYFNLITNFTYYYYFPNKGDEFRQLDSRNLFGYSGKISKNIQSGNTSFSSTIGVGVRYDKVNPSELDQTVNGQFLSDLQVGRIKELNSNLYLEQTMQYGQWLFYAGIRTDFFRFSYQNMAPASDNFASSIFNGINPDANGIKISPKVSAQYTLNEKTQIYLKAGKGFHSNDARVVVANRNFDVLPSAYGVDLGINWKPAPKLFINMAFWYLYLQQEFVYGQDLTAQSEGPVSPSGRTLRIGLDFSARYQLCNWLFAAFNANLARPRYIDSLPGHNFVPLAPTLTSTAGLNYKFKNGINGGINYRYLYNRPADSENTFAARGYFITDLSANYTCKRYEIGFAIENLFNRQWDESQFEYSSQLKGETKPVTGISYTPGVPFFAKLKFAVFF